MQQTRMIEIVASRRSLKPRPAFVARRWSSARRQAAEHASSGAGAQRGWLAMHAFTLELICLSQ